MLLCLHVFVVVLFDMFSQIILLVFMLAPSGIINYPQRGWLIPSA